MSLSSALSIAQSALLSTSRQTSVVTRNVADASNPDYARRTGVVVSTAPGARMVTIQRAVDQQLFRQNITAISAWSGQSTLASGLDRLQLAVNGVDNASSASSAIGKLHNALQLYATTPSNPNVGTTVVDAAKQAVRSLNNGTQAIQAFRAEADSQIAASVSELNQLLAQFEDVNKAIVSGTRTGTDVSDALDKRDALLKRIAGHVPVTTHMRADNDMVITTTNGITMFETVARPVSFAPSAAYSPGMAGSTVYIDNVPVSAGTDEASGKLAGLLQLRDGTSVTMQAQLDEIARGLISAFAESAPPLPDAAGLFTWNGAPGVPGALVTGLAGQISVNAAFDPEQGGNVTLLRDGGANGAAYVANAGGTASFADRLIALGDRLDQPMTFSPASGITASSSVTAYSASAIGWLDNARQQATTQADTKEALASRTAEALSNATGVNIDSEMSLMLDLEHTYQASARLLSTVDEMLKTLLNAV